MQVTCDGTHMVLGARHCNGLLYAYYLRQWTSVTSTDSAWSEFEFVFNRRRNRMGKERASLLLYAHCNTRLLRRFKTTNYSENWVPCSDSEDSEPEDVTMDDEEE